MRWERWDFAGVSGVRAGKVIELELDETDPEKDPLSRGGGDGAQAAGQHA